MILTQYEKEQPKILILEGAVRSGKTFINNALFYKEVRTHTGAGRNYIVTGHTVGSIKRNIIEPMNGEFGLSLKLSNQENSFSLYGNTVYCFGADKADAFKTMTGMTADGWYGNEVTLQHINTIQEAFNRTSGDDAHIIWDTNPDFPEHHIKTDYIDNSGERLSNGQLRIQAWHFTIDDNPYLDPVYVENLKKSTPEGMWYDRKIKGLWVAAEGLVYEGFDINIHRDEDITIPDEWSKYRSIDFGFNNPFVCLWGAVDNDNILHIYDEHYKAEKLLKYHARAMSQREGEWTRTVADHDRQDRFELADLGVSTNPAKKDVESGIQRVAERLVVRKNGKPGVLIHPRCVNTIREFGRYVWKSTTEGQVKKEEPLKVHDHTMDALRYMVMEIDYGGFIIV